MGFTGQFEVGIKSAKTEGGSEHRFRVKGGENLEFRKEGGRVSNTILCGKEAVGRVAVALRGASKNCMDGWIFGDGGQKESVQRFVVCRVKTRRKVIIGLNGVGDAMATEKRHKKVLERWPVAQGTVEVDSLRNRGDVFGYGRFLFVRRSVSGRRTDGRVIKDVLGSAARIGRRGL